MMRPGVWWRSGPGPGRFPPPCGERFMLGTGAAGSRAAACASARGIISATGRTGGRRRCPTSRCSVLGIIARYTRRASRSRAGPTGRSSSGGRMATRCLRCRRPQQCPVIPSGLSALVTTLKGFGSARGRGVPAGSGNASTWDGPSTSCTRSPRELGLVQPVCVNRSWSSSGSPCWRARQSLLDDRVDIVCAGVAASHFMAVSTAATAKRGKRPRKRSS
jgi:hypothetical protein